MFPARAPRATHGARVEIYSAAIGQPHIHCACRQHSHHRVLAPSVFLGRARGLCQAGAHPLTCAPAASPPHSVTSAAAGLSLARVPGGTLAEVLRFYLRSLASVLPPRLQLYGLTAPIQFSVPVLRVVKSVNTLLRDRTACCTLGVKRLPAGFSNLQGRLQPRKVCMPQCAL